MKLCVLLATALAAPLFAVQVPVGTEIPIRLTDKVSSAVESKADVHATVIAPVMVGGAVVLPAGLVLTGKVKQARPYSEKERALLELSFTSVSDGKVMAPLSAVVSSLE